ncbi:copper resistance CopC family protein [Corynebacterium sp. 335C]
MTTTIRRIAAALGSAALLAGGAVAAPAVAGEGLPVAAAHDSVVDSTPPNGGSVDEFPREIQLVFSGEPKPSFNTVAVSDQDTKEVLFTAEPELDGRNVTVEVPDDVRPGPGSYLVGFQITSSDGHSTRGMVTFSVGDGRTVAPGPGAEKDPSEGGDAAGGVPAWAYVAGGVLIALVIAVVAGVAVVKKKG